MKHENKLKEQKAITLIALVITIVVMLILAGVIINLTLGENGIFTTATKAAQNYIQAEQQELAELDHFEDQMNQYVETSSHSGVVHYEAVYKVASYNEETNEYTYIELKAGEKFPETVSNGDVYIYGDYEYRYNQYYDYYGEYAGAQEATWIDNAEQNGWGVKVLDRTKTLYGEILTSINEKNITSLNKTFRVCSKMVKAPDVPMTVTDMTQAFAYCSKLQEIPRIPDGVKNMKASFRNCTSLTRVTDLPNTVENLESTFYQCTSLISVIGISDSVTNMKTTFFYCTSLNSVDYISNNITTLYMTFKNCSSLKTVPTIPSGVTNMFQSFEGCTSLTNTIVINANPTSYGGCFTRVDFRVQNLTLTGSSNLLDELGATGKNYSSSTN